MRKKLTIDSVPTSDFGIYISGSGIMDTPDPDVQVVKIPGRNGDLVYSNFRYSNIKLTYPAFIKDNFYINFHNFRAFLLSSVGYRRLEDTYSPEYYRLGRISGSIKPTDILWKDDVGQFKLTFDCMPQHFLLSGEQQTAYTEDSIIINPTFYEAFPMIRVYGYGELSIGDRIIAIDENTYPYIDVDCEIQDVYSGNDNLNNICTVYTNFFPSFAPGQNQLKLSSTIDHVEIIPRWWTI